MLHLLCLSVWMGLPARVYSNRCWYGGCGLRSRGEGGVICLVIYSKLANHCLLSLLTDMRRLMGDIRFKHTWTISEEFCCFVINCKNKFFPHPGLAPLVGSNNRCCLCMHDESYAYLHQIQVLEFLVLVKHPNLGTASEPMRWESQKLSPGKSLSAGALVGIWFPPFFSTKYRLRQNPQCYLGGTWP